MNLTPAPDAPGNTTWEKFDNALRRSSAHRSVTDREKVKFLNTRRSILNVSREP